MDNLIEQYLLLHKSCPLPGIGVLELKEQSAILHQGENKLSAPFPFITLNVMEENDDSFVSFITAQKNISSSAAAVLLDEYCSQIKETTTENEFILHQTGSFYVNKEGRLSFRQVVFPDAFLPVIHLKKVIHPNANHYVRVGDTDTTTDEMTHLLNKKVAIISSKWWIAVIILLLVAIGLIILYFNHPRFTSTFGNVTIFTQPGFLRSVSLFC